MSPATASINIAICRHSGIQCLIHLIHNIMVSWPYAKCLGTILKSMYPPRPMPNTFYTPRPLFSLIFIDFLRFSLIFKDFRWFSLIFTGFHRFSLISATDFHWFLRILATYHTYWASIIEHRGSRIELCSPARRNARSAWIITIHQTIPHNTPLRVMPHQNY